MKSLQNRWKCHETQKSAAELYFSVLRICVVWRGFWSKCCAWNKISTTFDLWLDSLNRVFPWLTKVGNVGILVLFQCGNKSKLSIISILIESIMINGHSHWCGLSFRRFISIRKCTKMPMLSHLCIARKLESILGTRNTNRKWLAELEVFPEWLVTSSYTFPILLSLPY